MQENVISVAKLCGYIKRIFDSEELLHNISAYGEVSGLSISRGIAYFNLKDEDAMLPCVYFGINEELNNGDKIIATGTPGYYVKGGKLNFNVLKTKPYGLGEIYQKFLETKNKLEKEGLFLECRKKPLPKDIRRIGVVSSETGAVIQDIINVATRRDDSVDIVLYPASVQGIYAENEIIRAIEFLDNYNVDVIVVARGGGSFEDLNVFNSERIARVVADAKKPIISAVGHETDFTIIDFVSDLRAPTPSAAAEILTQIKNEKKQQVLQKFLQLQKLTHFELENKFELYNSFRRVFESSVKQILRDKEYEYALTQKILEKHNPIDLLNKGYAFIEKDGNAVGFDNIKIDDEINIIIKGGKIGAVVKNKFDK